MTLHHGRVVPSVARFLWIFEQCDHSLFACYAGNVSLWWRVKRDDGYAGELARYFRSGSNCEILAKSRCFLLCLQQQTSLNRVSRSVRCHVRKSSAHQEHLTKLLG